MTKYSDSSAAVQAAREQMTGEFDDSHSVAVTGSDEAGYTVHAGYDLPQLENTVWRDGTWR